MPEKQRRLSFDRQTNFANLDVAIAHLAEWCPLNRKGLANRLKDLLRNVEYCTGATGCNARAEVLAAKCGMSVRNLRRLIRDAVSLRLIELTTSIDVRTGGRGPNRLRIQWERIAQIADRHRSDAPTARTRPPGHDVLAPGHDVLAPGHDVRAYKKVLTPPLNSNLKNPPPASSSDEWQGVEEELIALGLVKAADAVVRAKARGCSPDFVRRLSAVYRSRPGQWGPGALWVRIRNAFPNQTPEDLALWPAVAAGFAVDGGAPAMRPVVEPPLPAESPDEVHDRWLRDRRQKGLPTAPIGAGGATAGSRRVMSFAGGGQDRTPPATGPES